MARKNNKLNNYNKLHVLLWIYHFILQNYVIKGDITIQYNCSKFCSINFSTLDFNARDPQNLIFLHYKLFER